jgi:hypothetical protein
MIGLLKIVGGALGGAAYLFVMLILFLGIPLGVIALMRLFGWEWWTALIAIIIGGIIPLVGPIAGVILAFLGAYYMIDAGFDWRIATGQEPKVFDLRQLSDAEFDRYKTTVLVPQFETYCKQQAADRLGLDGAIPSSSITFCECYAKTIVSSFSKDEFMNNQLAGELTPEQQRRIAFAAELCL